MTHTNRERPEPGEYRARPLVEGEVLPGAGVGTQAVATFPVATSQTKGSGGEGGLSRDRPREGDGRARPDPREHANRTRPR